MLAALGEGDFSIRVRGAGSRGPLAVTYLEANALQEVLREQRLGAVEATALLRKVLGEVDLAVFAFDEDETLRLLNRAGEALLGQPSKRLIGRQAAELRLQETLRGIRTAHPRAESCWGDGPMGGSGVRWYGKRAIPCD